MEQKLAQLKARLEEDSGLLEKLFKQESSEQVQAVLKAEGIELTIEEIDTIKEAIAKMFEKEANGELSDDNLEDVAGGTFIKDTQRFIQKEGEDLLRGIYKKTSRSGW